jgi:hypothetical protein
MITDRSGRTAAGHDDSTLRGAIGDQPHETLALGETPTGDVPLRRGHLGHHELAQCGDPQPQPKGDLALLSAVETQHVRFRHKGVRLDGRAPSKLARPAVTASRWT